KYFGQKYPYEKIDFIGVPEFWAGAMENPGAITYRENLLLLEPTGASVSQRRWLASTMAHELAHMWFGDLVTLEWWDDTWLNEAFASWMGDKITAEVFPEYKMENTVVNSSHSAMHTDALTTTKQVRRKVLPGDNIHAAFDNLAYSKGQAVLGMFENRIGAETFRQGVLNYIKENQWGNANAADFWRALSQVSGYNIEQVMAPYLDKPGVPLVTAELAGNNQVRLTQRRFTNYGGEVDQSTVWQIPVVIKYSDGGKTKRHPVLLTEKSMTFQLPADGKIEWIYPNADCIGYYRWNLPAEMMLNLAGRAQDILEPGERIGLLSNLSALLDGGMVNGDQYLKVLNLFADDPEADVVSVMVNGIGKVKSAFITLELQNSFAAYIRETLRPALKRFGFVKSKNEDEVVSVFRPKLLDWLADDGKDTEAMKFAVESAKKYMTDPTSVDPSLVSTVLKLSALNGDKQLFEAYKSRFETTQNPAERPRFLYTLGNFRDPELIKQALEYVLTGPIRPHEIYTIPSGISGDKRHEDLVFEWYLEHYGAVTSKMPPSAAASMPFIAMGCSKERLEKAKEFFSNPAHKVTGTDEQMEKVASYIMDCVNLREREGAAVTRYLKELVSVN
ncbi:MAG: ERAP1-like C-terminal domain-containing protein, partial [candidate division Zixibacteria bacterium]|nr:ERAP1-like C-terminal domain-containing protein [candidate division Zixibacteria bacterium]